MDDERCERQPRTPLASKVPSGTPGARPHRSARHRLYLGLAAAVAVALGGAGGGLLVSRIPSPIGGPPPAGADATPATVVDGWVIGPERTCADLTLSDERCTGLVARAIQAMPATAATPVHQTLHDVTYLVDAQGHRVLSGWGSGIPFGIVLVEYSDGSRHVGFIGCFGVQSPSAPADPLCPTRVDATPGIPTQPPAQATSTWTPVDLPTVATPAAPFGGPQGGIAALPGGGFVDFVATAPDRSVVLRSADGSHWAQVGEVTGPGSAGISGPVASDGHVYVALGSEGGGPTSGYGMQTNGAAWVSVDLRHWTKAPVQDAFDGAELRGIAAGPAGFVAIGYARSGRTVWTSLDGLHWTVLVDDRLFPVEQAEPTGILHTDSGFVMVGRIGQDAVVWTSPDGRSWTARRPLPGVSGIVLRGLAAGPAGFVSLSVGGQTVESPAGDVREPVTPWLSPDGVNWHTDVPDPALFGASASIVGAPGGYVAAGQVGLESHLWTSRKGLAWVPVAGVDLAGCEIVALVSDGSHVLLSATGPSGAILLVSSGVTG